MRNLSVLGIGLAGVAALAVIVVSLWRSPADAGRFATLDHPLPSPSGAYVAQVEPGAPQRGVATWVVTIVDRNGREVWRDEYEYSTRHGIGITWLSTADQLWLISSDIGLARVDRGSDGAWTKTVITPEVLANVPPEIAQLRR